MIAIRDFTRSSSFRVGALLSSLAIIAIVFIIYFWRLASSDVFIREAEAAVNAEAFALTQLYDNLGVQPVIAFIGTRDIAPASYDDKTVFALQDNSSNIIAGNLSAWPKDIIKNDARSPVNNTAVVALAVKDTKTGTLTQQNILYQVIPLGEYTLFVGRNINDLYSAQWLGKTFSWVIIVLLCLLGVVSFTVAIYVVKRINRMSQTADNIISTGSLEERLEIDSNWDDLSRLSVVFNHMLDTIESSVNNIKSVTDSIAHDLRTPLARLRNTLERIDDEQLRYDTTQEADNLLNMFNSLLRISGLESNHKKDGFTITEINRVVEDVVDLYHPLAEEKNIALSFNINSVSLFADPNLLFQAVANIVDNAIKYSPTGGDVSVELTTTPTNAVIIINDSGIGVAEHDIVNLERRFYRADGSRTLPGNGLGLSLVSAIVRLHGGHVWFVHDPLMRGHGLGVVLSIPLMLPTQ